MISCKELVKLKSSSAQLGFFKNLEMKIHLMMCDHCTKYAKHLKRIGTEARNWFTQESSSNKLQVDELKQNIIKSLTEED